MITVANKDQGMLRVATLSGTLDERTNLSRAIGKPKGELHVYCGDVLRMNSLGVRAWVLCFQKLAESGVPIKFFELAPILVLQAASLTNFIPASAETVSVIGPFQCRACRIDVKKVIDTGRFKSEKLILPEVSCPGCGKPTIFDDHENIYLEFFKRNSQRRGG